MRPNFGLVIPSTVAVRLFMTLVMVVLTAAKSLTTVLTEVTAVAHLRNTADIVGILNL